MTFSPAAGQPEGTPPLVLAVEATRLAREERGIGRYVRALLPRLLALRPGLRLVLFAKPRDVAHLAAAYADAPSTRGRVEVRPVRELPRARADVFWYPWNIAQPLPRRGVVVATVHDIAPVALADPRLPRWRVRSRRRDRRLRRLFAATAARATLLVVDSAFTRAELRRVFDVPDERMRVVPLAADDGVPPPPGGDTAALARLGVRRPFVLAVGAADRRKNLGLLDRAMPRVAAEVPGVSLVLAGPRGDAGARRAGDAPWKRTLGYVSDADLAVLYRAAGCLVMPSLYEGFGLPVLEAMRLGTAVVCVRASSLPEVAGDAAAWVGPDDAAQLATVLTRVLSDDAVRGAMRDAGLARSARFSWDETARLTLAALDEAAALGERRVPHPARADWRWPLRALRRRLGARVHTAARDARLPA